MATWQSNQVHKAAYRCVQSQRLLLTLLQNICQKQDNQDNVAMEAGEQSCLQVSPDTEGVAEAAADHC